VSSPAARPRVVAIDLLRLVMSFQMIQGHTIGALLDPRFAEGPMHEAWTFLRGLTAVGFLTAAGASYALASRTPSRDPLRRLRRAALLVTVGFLLRPPADALSPDPLLRAAAWDAFFAVDVLQCIGVTLLGLEVAARVSPRARSPLVAGAIGAGFLLAAPLLAPLSAEAPLRWALDWVTRSGGSLFPLFPWAGFVWIGLALAPWIEASTAPRGALSLGAVGVGLAALGHFAQGWLPPVPPAEYYAWPPFSLERLGLVLALVALLALAGRRLVLPRWGRTLAEETLVLYVVHLVLLHAAGFGLVHWVGPTLDPLAALGVAAVMMAVSASAALGWAALRARRREA
jgi:uncharacterized membrane protein